MVDPTTRAAQPPDLDAPELDRAPDHTSEIVKPTTVAPEEELHLGAGPELTACGQPRVAGLKVTDSAGIFREAQGGRLHTHLRVCPTCESRLAGGPMR